MPLRRWQGCGVAETIRLDRFLWFARIVKTRGLAQQLAEGGRIRLSGRIVDRAHAAVRVGDVLSFAVQGKVRVLRVEKLPMRRGPPAEAALLYSEVSSVPRDQPLTSEGGGD